MSFFRKGIFMAWDDFPSQKGSGPSGGGSPSGRNESGFDFPKINLPDLQPKKIFFMAILGLLVWLGGSSFFLVGVDEEGLVLRFGKHIRTVGPGLNWKLPSPLESVLKPKVTQVRREEIGFRLIEHGPPAKYRDVPEESLMVTGDENIIDIDMVVQYKVSDAGQYLFNAKDVRKAVLDASEAAIREVIGGRRIDEALTVGKSEIQIQTKELIQTILGRYEVGLMVTAVQLQDVHPPKQVVDAFKDVVSAREDKERMINEAQGYQNMVIPETRGNAAQIIKAAEGYMEEKINRAKGDAAKFEKIFTEYKKAEDITRKRLYIEMMEETLSNVQKIIADPKSGSSLIPIFPFGGEGKILGKAVEEKKN